MSDIADIIMWRYYITQQLWLSFIHHSIHVEHFHYTDILIAA